MQRWCAGFLMLISAGITFVVAAFVPWAQLSDPSRAFYAWQLRMFVPWVGCLAIGAFVLAFAFRRSVWAGLVGIVAAIAAAFTVLMIHGNLYVGLGIAVPGIRLGEITHVAGLGTGVLFAAGMMAGIGGLVATVQTAPKVDTRA